MVQGRFAEYRANSRFILVRTQATDPAEQFLTYYVWEHNAFRQIGKWREKKRF